MRKKNFLFLCIPALFFRNTFVLLHSARLNIFPYLCGQIVEKMTEKHFCLDDSPEFRWLELDEVSSTNDYLKNYRPLQEQRMTLVTAEHQTAGRGAGSNAWESRPGENLLFSLLTHPRHIDSGKVFLLSEALALAVREALGGEGFAVKWPNDIYYGERKVCGMLIENDLRGKVVDRCIMGVGVNVNQTEFAFDRTQHDGLRLMAEPVSLAQIVGHPVERRFVLERVVEHFDRYYRWTEEGRTEELHQMYIDHLYRRGEEHRFVDKDGCFRGTIVDVEPTGHLIITDAEGQRRRYAFKEVAFSA